MDEHRSTTFPHVLSTVPSRRHVLHALAGLGLALGAAWLPDDAEAKKKKKRKKKRKKKTPTPLPTIPPPPPPGVPNQYGCLSVDVPCTSADQCCTGLCEDGACRAHGTGTCDQEAVGMCSAVSYEQTLCNNSTLCACLETTGGSKFCGGLSQAGSACADCRKDADCLALGFPAGTACAPFSTGVCVGNCESGMVCIAPCSTKLPR